MNNITALTLQRGGANNPLWLGFNCNFLKSEG